MIELGKVKSVAVFGIEAYVLEVEVYVTKGQLPSAVVIGLPDATVKECRDRNMLNGRLLLLLPVIIMCL